MDEPRDILIERKISSASMAGVSLTFGLIGLWFVLRPRTFESEAPPEIIVLIGVFGILFGAQGLYTTIRNHSSDGYAVRMSPSGLSIRVGGGLFDIPWEDISDTFIIGSSSNRALGIRLVNARKHLAEQTVMFKLIQILPPYHGTPVWIPQGAIKQELDKVREGIEMYRHIYRNKAS